MNLEGMEVVGWDADGDIEGDLEGDLDGDIVGIVKRNPRTGRGMIVRARPKITLPAKADWRKRQMAAGVQMPHDDRLPLPLAPQQNGGVFTAAVNTIVFQGEPQKPFHGVRLLVSVVRTGVTATGRLLGQQFAGTDLQQADIGGFDIEVVGAANSFDTAIGLSPVEPGVKIRLQVTISTPPAGADTVFASIQYIGNYIH